MVNIFFSKKIRNEVLGDEDQSRGRRDPFVGRHRQPDGIAGAGHADKLLGGDIGSDDGSADRPPGQPAPGQEIIAGIPLVPFLLPGDKQADEQDQGTVGDKNDQVIVFMDLMFYIFF